MDTSTWTVKITLPLVVQLLGLPLVLGLITQIVNALASPINPLVHARLATVALFPP